VEADFILRETESGTFSAVREALAEHNISTGDLRMLITLGNAEAIALAVQEGIGVGFISQVIIDRLCTGKVAEVRVRGLKICREIYIGHNQRRPATGAQTAFWNFLTALKKDQLEISV
jgi:DNA-binding transcriptional LysR family regulator